MYKNLFGTTFLLYAAGTVGVLYLFSEKINLKVNKETKIYFIEIILFGLSTCITASKLLQFFNWCFVIMLLLLAMISQFFEKRQWNLGSYFIYLAKLFFSTIGYTFLPVSEAFTSLKSKKKADHKKVKPVIFGIIAAVSALFIIFPLLLSSDMIFRTVFAKMFSPFNLIESFSNIDTVIGISITFIFGFTLIYALFYASCHAQYPEQPNRNMPYFHPITGITFSGIIAGIYLLYSGIQITYLFMGAGLPAGITYSEYARSGFWQLMLVAFINVCLVLGCMYLFSENKGLKILLTVISCCTYIMICSADWRMYLYVKAYHLTFLRVCVFYSLVILAILMLGVIISIYVKKFPLTHYIIGVITCGYLLFSFAQPDYWIAKYNVSHIQHMNVSDLDYLLYGLSLDAVPAISEIKAEQLSGEGFGFQSEGSLIYSDMIDRQNDSSTLGETIVAEQINSNIYDYYRTIYDNNKDLAFRKANYSRIRAKNIAYDKLKELNK
ncbi:DUF4173 domain-containing protein [Roseburia hominis]